MFIVFKFYLKHSYGLMNRFKKKESIKFANHFMIERPDTSCLGEIRKNK